jgi:hypothetical protein
MAWRVYLTGGVYEKKRRSRPPGAGIEWREETAAFFRLRVKCRELSTTFLRGIFVDAGAIARRFFQ